MSCVGIFTCRYTFGNKKGVTEPHQAGASEPAGAAGPAPCHDSSPSVYHFHKHTLDGEDSPWLCRFDPKGVKGSTWIHRPTSACIQPPLQSNPEHSLPVAVHHTALSRYDRIERYDRITKCGIWRNRPRIPTHNRPRRKHQDCPQQMAVNRRCGRTSRCGRAWLPPPQRSN
jgi:hypothetical protein